jgi:hypothetical protein
MTVSETARPAGPAAATTGLEPATGWRATALAVGDALRRLTPGLPADSATRPAVAGLHVADLVGGADTIPELTVWSLDVDPPPGSLVVLGDGAGGLVWHRGDDLELHDAAHAPGTGVWGTTEVWRDGSERVVARLPSGDGDGVAAPSAVATHLVGRHALDVAGRFRTAFLARAVATARGWSAVRMIDDPTVLKALLRSGSELGAARALLDDRPTDAAGAAAADAAGAAAAGLHALDAARDAVARLRTLTGATALYDGNAMQACSLHLAALGQHPLFSRAARLRTARALARTTTDLEQT